jgi:uncharacterized membrane protein
LVFAINHQRWLLYGLLLLVVTAAVLVGRGQRRPPVEAETRPAQIRLDRAQTLSRRHLIQLTLVASGLVCLTVSGLAVLDARQPQLSDPEPFEIIDGQAVIPLTVLADGHLHRFAYPTADGTEVRFIIVQKNAMAYGVGLDACEICGATGYLEKSGKIICRLCDVVINVATIGYRGGCNPIPLEHKVTDGAVRINLTDLEAGAPHFA